MFAWIGVHMKKKEMQATGDGEKVNMMKKDNKFLMVSALVAIGLNTSLVEFKKVGLKPMFYGITIDTLVTLTALIVIWCMGLM